MTITTRPDSVLQRLVNRMLSRIQLAGLMHAFLDPGILSDDKDSGPDTGDGTKEVDKPPLLVFFDEFAEILALLDEGATISGLEPIHLAEHPFVYNAEVFEEGDPWASDGLDGRAVSVRKLMAGYSSVWRLQIESPGGATNRVVKAAVWFAEQQRNRASAFRLLLELNRAGFFCRRKALGFALIQLAKLYSARADYSDILQLTFANEGQGKADRLVSGFDSAYLLEIGAWLLDQTRRSIARARAASSPTEWKARLAETSNLIEAVELFQRVFEVMEDLPQPIRIQYLALEEITCDFGAIRFGLESEIERDAALQESWSMAGAMLTMQMVNGGLEAVERLFSARLLLPDAVRQYVWPLLPVREVGRHTDYFEKSPAVWNHLGFDIAHVLGRQLGINPALLRWNRIATQELPQGDEPGPFELNVNELRSFGKRYGETSSSGADKANRSQILDEVLALYPLHDGYRLERAILHDEMGLHETALEELIENVCLSPTQWMHWQSLSVVCGKLGYSADRLAARLIWKFLEGKSDASGD